MTLFFTWCVSVLVSLLVCVFHIDLFVTHLCLPVIKVASLSKIISDFLSFVHIFLVPYISYCFMYSYPRPPFPLLSLSFITVNHRPPLLFLFETEFTSANEGPEPIRIFIIIKSFLPSLMDALLRTSKEC